jgi:hypothetical protein
LALSPSTRNAIGPSAISFSAILSSQGESGFLFNQSAYAFIRDRPVLRNQRFTLTTDLVMNFEPIYRA